MCECRARTESRCSCRPTSMYSAERSSSSIVAAMPRFSSTGLLHFAEFAQQLEVLHVARADLEDVDISTHQRDLRLIHYLADDEQLVAVGRVAQELQSGLAEALESCRESCAA